MSLAKTPPAADLRGRWLRWLLAAAFGAAALYPAAMRLVRARLQVARLDRISTASALVGRSDLALAAFDPMRSQRFGSLLASWQSFGGCGAGGSASLTGIKWVGRNVTGGLIDAQIQTDYVSLNYGYNYALSAQVSRTVADKWVLGAVVPYLYKYYRNYRQLPVDVSNGGLGDISLLATRRLGPINATTLTAAVGLPTGTHDASYKMDIFTQDKQLGFGRVTGTLILDHITDETWGLVNVGAIASYRGGRNDLGSYRAPAGTAYGYAGYILGPFVPALGLSMTGFAAHDQDRGLDQDVPLAVASVTGSIEWSTDWVAVLLGGSPVLGVGNLKLQSWTLAVGVAVSPF